MKSKAVDKAETVFAAWYELQGFACPPDSSKVLDHTILRVAFLAGVAHGMEETQAVWRKAIHGFSDRDKTEV